MNRQPKIVLFAIATLMLVNCDRIFEATGKRTFLKVEISFEDHDHRPEAAVRAYVVESIGTLQPITEVLTTNSQGAIILDGYYCLPAVVAVRGGNVTVHPQILKSKYVVRVTRENSLSLEHLFGEPNKKYLGWSRRNNDCG